MHRFLVVLVLLFLFSDVNGRQIFVSQKNGSHDTTSCGSMINPCLSLKFAVENVADDLDQIIIDGGNKTRFEYRSFSIHVNKSLTISKHNASRLKPVITASYRSPSQFIFLVFYNSLSYLTLSLDSIIIASNFGIRAFGYGNVAISNCSFYGRSLLWFDGTRYGNYTFRIYSSVIKGFDKDTPLLSVMGRAVLNGKRRHLANIFIENCTFINSQIKVLSLEQVYIFNSKFLAAERFDASEPTGSPITLSEMGIVKIENCHFLDGKCGMIEITTAENVSIKNCDFEVNLSSTKGCNIAAVFNKNLKTLTLSSLTFHLYGLNSFGSAIYADAENGEIHNAWIRVLNPNSSAVTVITLAKNMGWKVKRSFVIHCPIGFGVETLTETHRAYPRPATYELITKCRSCIKGYYSQQSGIQLYDGLNLQKNNFTCTKCPPGAVCDAGKVISKDNYWGYIFKEQLHLLPCPPGYCCSKFKTPCSAINTCERNRQGTLCGTCLNGFSESLFKTKCVKNEHCTSSTLFIILYILSSIIFVYILIYIKDILSFMKNCYSKLKNILSRHKSNDDVALQSSPRLQVLETEGCDNLEASDEYEIIDDVSQNVESKSCVAGTIKIIFQFYQISSLIRISTSTKTDLINFSSVITDLALSIFNVKFTSTSSICPFQDMTVVKKEALLASMPVALLAVVFVSYVFHCVYWRYRKSAKKAKKESIEQTDEGENCSFNSDQLPVENITDEQQTDPNKFSIGDKHESDKMTFDVRLKSGTLQIMLLGYLTISVFLFKCVRCVNVKNEQRLYIQADTVCYTKLQILAWFTIAIWVVPFCFSLYISRRLLSSQSITPNQFLATLFFPPVVIYFLLRAFCFQKGYEFTDRDKKMSESYELVLSEPFRENSDKSGRILWEFVLIMRKLILTLIFIFTIQSVIKLYLILILLIPSLIHHVYSRPYNSKQLNALETLSLLLLCGICALNTIWAFSYVLDITSMPYYELFGKTIICAEMIALMFPLILLVMYLIISLVRWSYKKLTNKQD